MIKRLSLCAALIGLSVSLSLPASARSSCFTPDEAQAAHFRTMLQEFNVAALNCQSVDPKDPTPSIHDRYNSFVSKFGPTLQHTAQTVRRHFQRTHGNLDRWVTQVANGDGQTVTTDANYCQHASDTLDKALTLDSAQLESFATTAMAPDPYVEECPAKPLHHAVKAAHHRKAKAKSHHHHHTEKTAEAN